MILTHKKVKYMNESFRDYNDLNRVLEFPVTLVWTEMCIFTYVLNSIVVKMMLCHLLSTLQGSM